MAATAQFSTLSLLRPVRSRSRVPGTVCSVGRTLSWTKVLDEIDEKLAAGDDRSALSLVKDLQGKDGGLRCFGAARQVPQRLYSLDELKLNGIETASLLSPVDGTLGAIQSNLQLASLAAGISAYYLLGWTPQDVFYLSLAALFLWTLDSVSFNGGIGSLIVDTVGQAVSRKYHNRVIQHEAGHFLVAYLMGILPKRFTLSSLEALRREGSLNVQAGTAFVDVELLEEVNAGKVTATVSQSADTEASGDSSPNAGKMMSASCIDLLSYQMLNRFSCVALASVATEYLLYGQAEGRLADIKQLDAFLASLGFTQKKADSQVRWAVLNTILILRRHEAVRGKLAAAMSMGKSVGSCIQVIEESVDPDNI